MLFHVYDCQLPDGHREMILIRDGVNEQAEALAAAKRLWRKRQEGRR